MARQLGLASVAVRAAFGLEIVRRVTARARGVAAHDRAMIDVQRAGPSTGMPTRVSQGDLIAAHWLGHGDSKHPVYLPGSVYECFEFGWKALDLAERLGCTPAEGERHNPPEHRRIPSRVRMEASGKSA